MPTQKRKKYELTSTGILMKGDIPVWRIRALVDIPKHGVKAGDLGGWIEDTFNLDQEGSCWVSEEARVYDRARVTDNALVSGQASIYDKALVAGDAVVTDRCAVYSNAHVFSDALCKGRCHISGNACVKGHAVLDGDSTGTINRITVADSAVVSGNARITGTAYVHEYAVVTDDAVITGPTVLDGSCRIAGTVSVVGSIHIGGNVELMSGTIRKLTDFLAVYPLYNNDILGLTVNLTDGKVCRGGFCGSLEEVEEQLTKFEDEMTSVRWDITRKFIKEIIEQSRVYL